MASLTAQDGFRLIEDFENSVRWFGDGWNAPICAPHRRVDTPVGQECAECGVAIKHDDQGVILAHFGATAVRRPWHKRCFSRSLGLMEDDATQSDAQTT